MAVGMQSQSQGDSSRRLTNMDGELEGADMMAPSGNNSSSRRGNMDPQVDQLVKNMWDRMKSLEGKYIDLANYYKHELISS